MKNLLLLELISLKRTFHKLIPVITLPSIILSFAKLVFFNENSFVFSGIFAFQLMTLIAPILFSELMRGGWRVIHQVGAFYNSLEITGTLIVNSLIITLASAILFIITKYLLIKSVNESTFLVFILLVTTGLLSYAFGTLFRALLNDISTLIIISMTFEMLLLPFALSSSFSHSLATHLSYWPIVDLMSFIMNDFRIQSQFDLCLTILFKSIIIYFLFIVFSSWLLTKQIKI